MDTAAEIRQKSLDLFRRENGWTDTKIADLFEIMAKASGTKSRYEAVKSMDAPQAPCVGVPALDILRGQPDDQQEENPVVEQAAVPVAALA